MRSRRFVAPSLALLVVALTLHGDPLAAQTSRRRVTGVVTDEETKQPLPGVSVMLGGTSFGGLTGADGRYTITTPPTGNFTVEARRIGYSQGRTSVRIPADSTVTVNFALKSNPLNLESVVISGTIDPTSSLKVPFTVATLSAEDIPVPPTQNAAAAIAGKIAGAQVIRRGGPTGAVNIQLRSPASQFESTTPLFVVDGVILSNTASNTLADIDPNDIASIEVLKGSAASSLYGSRGANGVISIRTNNGRNLALNSTQFNIRTEYGLNSAQKTPTKSIHHPYLVNDVGQYVNAAGKVVGRNQRVLDPNGFKDNNYIDPLYNAADQFYKSGQFLTNSVTLQHNSEATNFALTYDRYREEGVVLNSDGVTRQSVRLNVGHRLRDNLEVTANAYHQRSTEDPSSVSFADFYRFDADVNLGQKGPDGNFIIIPDSTTLYTNPLYRQVLNDNVTQRGRTLLNGELRYNPLNWLTVDGRASYDHYERNNVNYVQRGMIGTDGITPSLGSLVLTDDRGDQINADIGATGKANFKALSTRLTVRALRNSEVNPYFDATGTDFSVSGVKDMDLARTRTSTSSLTDVRETSYLSSLTMDYAGKYIGDFLVHRDGNSLYGPDSRWNTFYRASGSWLVAEEKWWPFKSLNAFKLRYSIGRSGNRPAFSDQYENLAVSGGGVVTRSNLGNSHLKPEIATEQEVGIDAILKQRVSFQFVYANTVSNNNVISIPTPAVTGFNTQNQNVGSITGNTFEGTIQAQLINRQNFKYEINLVADRSRNKVTQFNRSCYTDGILNRCNGVSLGTFWGNRYIRSTNELRPIHANSKSNFQVNDDGYVVAVGAGNTYRDGVAKKLWGTTVSVDGKNYPWGMPILQRDSSDQVSYVQIGDGNADMNFGIGNTIRWRGFQIYGLVRGQFGGDIYNNTQQYLLQSGDAREVDQAGKPEELKKPVGYYTGNGLAYNNTGYINAAVEDGTYAKLAEVSVRYTLPESSRRLLSRIGASRLSVEVIGRNLATWTKYSGIDPEAGSPLARIDDVVYPLYRTFTLGVNLTF